MDSIQQQIVVLSAKIESLYSMIERLGDQTAEILEKLADPVDMEAANTRLYSHKSLRTANSTADGAMDLMHKDVLIDSSLSQQKSEQSLTPEIQIQRLTAQLTAAYNRIAALEEQLLAKRVIHQGS